MKEGTASHTARSVAARRLEYDRVAAPYGDPAADEALTGDVADGLVPARNRMHEYIRARTAFFDRVVVSSIDRGVAQVVIGGAGYDGRAFRYAKPGVRWFEVDHPATQADKLERIARLGLATPQVRFIPADFTADPVAEPLLAAGLDPARPALFLFEGVAVYLERPENERVLTEFREVTPAGSLLAISVSIGGATSQTRASFQQRVAELGEPARTVLTFDQAADLLSAAGWKIREPSDRQRSAGLLLARATTAVVHSERERLTPSPSVPPVAWQASAGPPAGRAAARRRPGGAAARARRPSRRPRSRCPRCFPRRSSRSRSRPTTRPSTACRTAPRTTASRRAHRPAPRGSRPCSCTPTACATCPTRESRSPSCSTAQGPARTWTACAAGATSRSPPTPATASAQRLTPSSARRAWGIEARDTWQAVTAEVESRWRDRLGAGAFDTLRAALAGVGGTPGPAAARLPSDPRLRPVHQARPGRQGRGSASRRPRSLRIARRSGDLPLWALLSRPLRAFAEQYEAEPGPSLAISANVLRVLTEAGVRTRDIPALGGVSKESVAMAMGVMRKSGAGDRGPRPGGRPVQGHPPHRQGRRGSATSTPRSPPTSSATGAPASATPR